MQRSQYKEAQESEGVDLKEEMTRMKITFELRLRNQRQAAKMMQKDTISLVRE